MLNRRMGSVVFDQEWGRQMRFITGPRQCGKTTLARQKLEQDKSPGLYYLWDRRDVRERYKKNELFFTEDAPPRAHPHWVCFDEIHKYPKWKNVLKAIFDSTQEQYRFIITGSAKFEMFKRAGDSLAGRYFTFHLFPLSIGELEGISKIHPPPENSTLFMELRMAASPSPAEGLEKLLDFSGFPEPFLHGSPRFMSRWSQDYLDRVVREDIGALTRIIDREYLIDLYQLLPEMVGSPISVASLAGHIELSPMTIKNHLRRMEDFYLLFRLPPYSKNIKRSLLKAPKVYLFDWTRVRDPGLRFENWMACELLSLTRSWEEGTGIPFHLHFVRTKDRQETDFLILRQNKPWLLIESKRSDGPVAPHHLGTQAQLGGIPFVQVCRQEGVASLAGKNAYRISATRFFSKL